MPRLSRSALVLPLALAVLAAGLPASAAPPSGSEAIGPTLGDEGGGRWSADRMRSAHFRLRDVLPGAPG